MTGAWKLDIASGPKLVLLSLCDNANDQGECFPSISMIAQRCSMGERTVQSHITTLTEQGFMRRVERTGRSTIYMLDPRKICAPADFAPPQISHPAPADSAPQPPQISRGTPADFAPITVKEPSKEPKKKTAHAAPSRPDDVDEQVWSDWLALRKAKRASVTQTVLDEARREASKAGLGLERFLVIWCMRGSQGLQADWLKPHELRPAAAAEPAWRTEQRTRTAIAAPGVAIDAIPADQFFLDVEVRNVTPRALG